MKLGPFEIRRSVTAATTTQPRRQIGAAGTINLDGFFQSDEHNVDLRWPQSIDVYRKMRRSDSAVREAEQHIFAPIKNATWTVEPGSADDELDLEAAEALRRALFGDWLEQPWGEFLNQALTHLSYGYQVFEPVEHVVEDDLEFDLPDGTQATRPGRQFLTWSMFAHRLPETIWKWNVEGGRLMSVEQQAFKDGEYGNWEIPADQLLVFTNEREGDDFTGQSILRTAHWPWKIKQLIEKISAIAVERHGIGTWLAFTGDQYKDDEPFIARLEDMLTALGLGDAKYMVVPAREGSPTTDGVTLRLETPSNQLPELVKLLEYFRGEIKGNVLARFAELGHGSVGARATGDVQSKVWYDALHTAASYICDVLNEGPVRRFMAVNYPAARPPKVTVEDIESRSLEEFANAHAKLLAADGIVPDISYRAFLRRSLDSPPEDDPEDAAAQIEDETEMPEPEPAEESEESEPPEQGEPEEE